MGKPVLWVIRSGKCQLLGKPIVPYEISTACCICVSLYLLYVEINIFHFDESLKIKLQKQLPD